MDDILSACSGLGPERALSPAASLMLVVTVEGRHGVLGLAGIQEAHTRTEWRFLLRYVRSLLLVVRD